MDGTCALVVLQEDTSQWEILFTTMQDIIAIQCEGAGIPAFYTVTLENWKQKNLPEELAEYTSVLVLESNRPLITAEEISKTYAIYQRTQNVATLFQDDRGQRSLSGWYPSARVEKPDNPRYAAVEDLTAVTTRRQLAEVNEFFRTQVIKKHWDAGVNIPLDHGVLISPTVIIGADTTIFPGTILKGNTTIGCHCEIGPNTKLTNMKVGDGCKIISSFGIDSQLHEDANIGPMANIRFGCEVGVGTKIGDFVELKNAKIGSHTSVAHLSYLGDCTVGSGCNFGCGSTIVNYDGTNKHHTTIGDDTFIGCHCSMIAPLHIGSRVYAAAGSTITEDVPDDALVIARARQTIKPEWSKNRGLFHKQ